MAQGLIMPVSQKDFTKSSLNTEVMGGNTGNVKVNKV